MCSSGTDSVLCDLSDINGNGSADIAVGTSILGSFRVQIGDGLTDSLISDLDFGTDPPSAVEVIDDLDGDDAPEVLVLVTRPSGQVRVVIMDSVACAVLNTI